ncbi:MAG: hypothetical protein KAQ98_12495 [Bacteriovoracaceae bacterium]|nr:hypothetical protein [Bacteriovoracaceae bacterium]
MIGLLFCLIFSFFTPLASFGVAIKSSGLPVKMSILDISPTGRTMVLDRGHYDGIRIGDKGDFYLFFNQGGIVGIGEAVKVHTKYSFWYFRKNVLGGPENKGENIYYFAKEMSGERHAGKMRIKEIDEVEYNYLDL